MLLIYALSSLAQAPGRNPRPDVDALWKAEEQLLKARQELIEKEAELLQTQAGLLGERIEVLKKNPKTAKAALALTTILDLKAAELKLKQAQANAQTALEGAKIVAADGRYLGRIGPTYDAESIFCSYGDYGATYSEKSIWCTYGKYGATYEELSPFCSYSTKPPKLIIDDTEIASFSVAALAGPIVLSPESLRGMYGARTSLGATATRP
jgi:hypothetical protein